MKNIARVPCSALAMPRPTAATIVWFRNDLRLTDQPALAAAIARGGPIVPVYIEAPDEDGAWPPGAASRLWRHDSLAALDKSLRALGSRLSFRRGDSLSVLRSLVSETGAVAVLWNRLFEPAILRRDLLVAEALASDGIEVQQFDGGYLFDPQRLATKQNTPLKVFAPFYRRCLATGVREPITTRSAALPAPKRWPTSERLSALGLEPARDWKDGIRAAWIPGEARGRQELDRFVQAALAEYSSGRDLLAIVGSSRLSPYLHFGELSPHQVWQTINEVRSASDRAKVREACDAYLRQLVWREFGMYQLFHNPQISDEPLRAEYADFPWESDSAALRAWQRGQTGYPLVDAGMRQLWQTGWMHNRVRMVASSFLVKHLLQPWQSGARWFWDTLVDADLANNTLGWQWVAGCGPDPAPFFRIFNPTVQSARHDPQGEYLRRWLPELARLPTPYIHDPQTAPREVLRAAGVELGATYPWPIVEHADARARALAAVRSMRSAQPNRKAKRRK